MGIVLRRCCGCGKQLELNSQNFYRNSRNTDGYSVRCKRCLSSAYKLWYNKNRTMAKGRSLLSNRKTREKMAAENLVLLRSHRLYNSLQGRCRKLGLHKDNRINVEFIYKLLIKQHCKCACCQIPLDLSIKQTSGPNMRSPSLDKIIPRMQYVPENVVILCFRCNAIKYNATFEEVLIVGNWLKDITVSMGVRHDFN